jgi:hypothetical protein
VSSNAPDRPVYHITHIDNISGIVARRNLYPDNAAASGEFVVTDIGMPSIKARRRTTQVPCGPGGTPADYVPFYFGPRSPMLFSISKGNVPTYQEGQASVVYLVTTVGAVRSAGLSAVFTEGNAGAGFVTFREDEPLQLEAAVDWPLMKQRYWFDTPDDPGRANRRQAEYLVHGSVPISLIRWAGAMTDEVAGSLRTAFASASLTVDVRVVPGWYY